eukprot:COSAG06_NODE_28142_length_580_cov_0.511435_2_plen_66_part_01
MGATVVFAQLVVYPKLSKALGPRRTFSLLTALQVSQGTALHDQVLSYMYTARWLRPSAVASTRARI